MAEAIAKHSHDPGLGLTAGSPDLDGTAHECIDAGMLEMASAHPAAGLLMNMIEHAIRLELPYLFPSNMICYCS